MAERFEPITLEWQGEQYKVEPKRVWGLVKVIEEKLNFYALGRALDAQEIPDLEVAEAYAAALRYAGASDVSEVDVQMELSGVERMANAYALWMIMMQARPDIKKKIQAAVKAQKPASKKSES
jgi:hypothetical protein